MTTDTWLSLSGASQAIRVAITQVSGQHGVSGGRLTFWTEVHTTNPGVAGALVWLRADIEVVSTDGGRLGTAVPTNETSLALPEHGSRQLILGMDLTHGQLNELDERHRVDGVGPTLRIQLRGDAWHRNQFQPVSGSSADRTLSLSEWVAIVEAFGLRKVLLIELDAPDVTRAPHLDAAIRYFTNAQRLFGEGRYREAVENLRQALNAIVGKPGTDEDTSESLQASMTGAKEQQRYPQRVERVRRTLKYLCDLGAHPETAETTRNDAVAALHITAALLQWYSRPPGRETS